MSRGTATGEAVDDRDQVLAALRHAGINPEPDEIDAMVAAYPAIRAATSALYAVPAARNEVPATTFDPRRAGA